MIAGLSIGSDARRYFHFSLPRLAIVTVILMPLLYGALYLWTFWNPFGEVDKIPVAIVNVDKGITLAGESLDAGAQVSKQLISSGQLDLTQVKTEKAAMADLESGKYYFVIVIPEDFSAAVASPTGNNLAKRRSPKSPQSSTTQWPSCRRSTCHRPRRWPHSFRRPRGG